MPQLALPLLFMDIETTGLSTTPLFLIGLLIWDGKHIALRQYLARDYSEEPALLHFFCAEASRCGTLISFNGRSYDIPYPKMRAAATGTQICLPGSHIDLLPLCRRAWGQRLPDCRLRTLGQAVCGLLVQEDIPGSQIPEAYHRFVRTADARELALIIHHNRIDLWTMAALAARLWGPPALQEFYNA